MLDVRLREQLYTLVHLDAPIHLHATIYLDAPICLDVPLYV